MSETDTSNNNIETGDTNDMVNGETTPLLSVSPSEINLEIAKRDNKESYLTVASQEFRWNITKSSLSIMALMLESSFLVVNVMSVSHLGANELAAMSLSLTCVGSLGIAPAFGLLSAMDTYCSTAFTASRDKTLVGFHFQRGIIAVLSHLIVITSIFWYSDELLLLVGQDPEISWLCGRYLRIEAIALLSFLLFDATKRFLHAQGIMHAGTIVLVIVTPIHWTINFFLVRSPTYGIGFIGAPISNVISNSLMFGGMLLYTYNSKAAEAWGGWTRSAFQNMKSFYRLAIPAVITVCAGWIGLELVVIGASYFGANQLAGQAVVLNSMFIVAQFSNGLGYATSPRVGNLIGAVKPRQARIAADVSLMISTILGGICTLFMIIWGGWWISVYTDDPLVVIEAAKLIPVACLFSISNGLNSVLGAILRGLGRQKVSANVYMLGFYCLGAPTGLYFGWVLHMETIGLWWGLCTGVVASSIIQIGYIYMAVNWNDEVRLCILRLKNKDTPEDIGSTSTLTFFAEVNEENS